jgi:putative ABC transport system permease protein
MKQYFKEIRVAARALRKRPGFTFLVVMTLSLGIGATSSIFSVVSSVLMADLPYDDSDRLVFFRLYAGQFTGSEYSSLGELTEFDENTVSFEQVAAVTGGGPGYVIVDGVPQSVRFSNATTNMFPMLGVQPLMGRFFTEEDERADFNGPPTGMIISYKTWQTVYSGDPEILSRRIEFEGANGQPGPEIIGVLPADFELELANGLDSDIGIWSVLQPFRRGQVQEYGVRFMRGMIGKLKPGVELETAQSEVDAMMTRIVAEHPESESDGPNPRFNLVPLFDDLVGPVRPTILILFSAVSLVFLVACGNAASVLLARTTMRQKEIALHAALGAGRATIARIILNESLLLALLSAGVGTLIANWGIQLLMFVEPGVIPRTADIGLDGNVLAFTVGLALFSTLVFGLIPALKASSPKTMNNSLRLGERIGGGIGSGARRALVVGQVAFSIILLMGTGLLVRTYVNLRQTDLGYNPTNVTVFRARLDFQQFRDMPQEERQMARWNKFRQFRDAVAEIPGVTGVGSGFAVPLDGVAGSWDVHADGGTTPVYSYTRNVVPGYLDAMQMSMVSGRGLDDSDNVADQSVAVVNQALVRALWPDESPIGKWVVWNQGEETDRRMQVVGIMRDARITSVDRPAIPQIYMPYMRAPGGQQRFVVRFAGATPYLISQLERIGEEVGLGRRIDQFRSADSYVAASTADAEFAVVIMSVLGGVALVLSVIGIFGTISYIVTLKTKEMGIRVALGAQSTNVISLNVTEGLQLTGLGILVGGIGAFISMRFLATLLYGVTPNDPLTFAGVSAMVIILGGLASLVPSLRAARVDPMVALRED